MTALHGVTDLRDSRPALINRQADFWLLGGASIAFWLLCHLREFLHPRFQTSQSFLENIPAVFGFFTLLINAPHFMASYHLAYSRGTGFIRENWFQLILVPSLLLIALIAGDLMFNDSLGGVRHFGEQLNYALEPIGIFLVIGVFPTFGPEMLHHMVNLMYLTVGWHYTKQVFGCFMVYSRYDNYSLSVFDRNLIKASLLSIWGFNYFAMNSAITRTDFSTAPYISHVFPSSFYLFFEVLTVLLFMAVAYRVFYVKWRDQGVMPPAAAVVA